MFKALYSDSITLHLINEENLDKVRSMFRGFPDSDSMLDELNENCLPKYEDGKRTRYGFYATLENVLAGMSLLDVDDWKTLTGSTGADTFLHMRGKGVAPRSKPHLFYLAFEILGLNRVETGCFVSNLASKKSIEKTIGFEFEGTTRQSGLNDKGELEDEYRYAILRQDWLRHYDKTQIKLI
jgi:RimJ/RimL family protein N-acetyltransferase